MKITLELDLGPNPDPMALSQWLMWAARSDVHTQYSEMKIPASMRTAADETIAVVTPTPAPIRASGNGAAQHTPQDIDPQFQAPGAEDEVDEPTTHAVPPGVASPVAPKKRGRPPKAKAEEVSAPTTQAFSPPAGAAIPPGVNASPVAAPAAAMPRVESDADGEITKESLRARLVEVQKQSNQPAFTFNLVRKLGLEITGKGWNGVDAIPPEHYDRVIYELNFAASQLAP